MIPQKGYIMANGDTCADADDSNGWQMERCSFSILSSSFAAGFSFLNHQGNIMVGGGFRHFRVRKVGVALL
jgi:hypothetical protein